MIYNYIAGGPRREPLKSESIHKHKHKNTSTQYTHKVRKYAAKKWQAKIVPSAKCIVVITIKATATGWQMAKRARRIWPVPACLGLAWLGWVGSVATTSCTCFQLNNVAFIFTG